MNIEFNIIIYVDGKKCKFLCTFPSWLRLPNDKTRLRENVGESLAMGLQQNSDLFVGDMWPIFSRSKLVFLTTSFAFVHCKEI